MDHVLAPRHFRVLFGVEPTDGAYARGLVDEILTCSPAAAGAH